MNHTRSIDTVEFLANTQFCRQFAKILLLTTYLSAVSLRALLGSLVACANQPAPETFQQDGPSRARGGNPGPVSLPRRRSSSHVASRLHQQ